MMTDLWKMYQEGRSAEVLELIDEKLKDSSLKADQEDDLLRLKAWCHYRRGEHEAAIDAASKSNHPLAGCVTLYVMAYQKSYMNREQFKQLGEELRSEVDALNALAIDAFKNPMSTDPEPFQEKVNDICAGWTPDQPDVRLANISQNTAKYFLARYQTEKNLNDLLKALCFEYQAIKMYGTETNVHHRAAAHFWLSRMYELSESFGLAVVAQKESVDLWEQQVNVDPTNKPFQEKLESGRERLTSLRKNI